LQPGLRHDQEQQPADDGEEGEDFAAQIAERPLLEGVGEGAVPLVQPDLPVGDGADYHDQRDGHKTEPDPMRRPAERAKQGHELRRDAAIGHARLQLGRRYRSLLRLHAILFHLERKPGLLAALGSSSRRKASSPSPTR
jgi:hypothetical protein